MINDQQLVQLFANFLSIHRETVDNLSSRILKHDYELPSRVRDFRAMKFIQMESGFTPQLLEATNRFLIDIHRAECWFKVAQKLDEDDRAGLIWDFAEPHLELAVGRPYSLKNLFTFAAVHLLHQSNFLKTPNWKDDLPSDRDIDYELLKNQGDGWLAFSGFIAKMEQLNDKAFCKKETADFRHKSQHRYRLQFDFGLTPVVERKKTEKGITYGIGAIMPLDVEKLVPQLYVQHQRTVDVFLAYWELVNELCAAWDNKYAQS
jgi:hypothetical protein